MDKEINQSSDTSKEDKVEKGIDKERKEGYNKYTFKKSNTLKEAQNTALQFSDSVNFNDINNIDNLNIVNETFADIYNKYDLDKLKTLEGATLKNANGSASFLNMKLSKKMLNSDAKDRNDWKDEIKSHAMKYETEKNKILNNRDGYNSMFGVKKVNKQIQDYENEIKLINKKLEFDRLTFSRSWDNQVQGTTMHELGHVLADQFFSQINYDKIDPYYSEEKRNSNFKKRQIVEDAYNKAKQNGDIKNISWYASTEPEEFFAETFAMNELKQSLPKYITDMLEEVSKK